MTHWDVIGERKGGSTEYPQDFTFGVSPLIEVKKKRRGFKEGWGETKLK